MMHPLLSMCARAVFFAATLAGIWSILTMRPLRSRALVVFVVALATMFVAAGFRVSAPLLFWDFTTGYYPAGMAVLHDDHAALRALTGVWFVNMPILAYLFAPFALLAPFAAAVAFTVIGVGLTLASLAQLIKLAALPGRGRWLLAFLFATNGPLIFGIKNGNASYLIISALVWGLVFLRAGRTGVAASVLAVAAMIKPELLLYGVFFLLRRDLKGLLAFSAVCAATTAASVSIFGWSDNLNWLQTCILQNAGGPPPGYSNQSILAFLIRLRLGPASLMNWDPQTPDFMERLVAGAASLLLATAFVVTFLRSRFARSRTGVASRSRLDLEYALTLCASLILSPLTWAHYLAWLLIPSAFFLNMRAALPSAARWAGWIAIALTTPLIGWPPMTISPWALQLYSVVVVSAPLLGALTWFGLIAWALVGSDTNSVPPQSAAGEESDQSIAAKPGASVTLDPVPSPYVTR
jgi:alpha-1,2-mannosyltransferase